MAAVVNEFERARAERIAANQEMLKSLGVADAAKSLVSPTAPAEHVPRQPRKLSIFGSAGQATGAGMRFRAQRKTEDDGGLKTPPPATRASRRVAGLTAETPGDGWEPSPRVPSEQERCEAGRERGNLYDRELGLTCHFCRQKKLCAEADCPRCSKRDADGKCIGKSECSRCHGPDGIFCSACLRCRYGQQLAAVRADPGWLCPHCYEEEFPESGWLCNSSLCMKHRGLPPTGIAVREAAAAGFASVAHHLQAQIVGGSVRPLSLAEAGPRLSQSKWWERPGGAKKKKKGGW